MELANIHRTIITWANEMGYFPTPADAKRINLLAAERARRGMKPDEIDAAIRDAIRDYFDNGARAK